MIDIMSGIILGVISTLINKHVSSDIAWLLHLGLILIWWFSLGKIGFPYLRASSPMNKEVLLRLALFGIPYTITTTFFTLF